MSHRDTHRGVIAGTLWRGHFCVQTIAVSVIISVATSAAFALQTEPVESQPVTSAEPSTAIDQSSEAQTTSGLEQPVLPEIDSSLPLELFRIGPAGVSQVWASATGTLSKVDVKPGQEVIERQKVAQMNDQTARLNWEKAWANYRIIQLQGEQADSVDASVALADLKLANTRLHQQLMLAPHYGTVQQILQQQDEFLQYGTAVMSIQDLRSFQVRVPILPGQLSSGTSILLLGQGKLLTGRVVEILPGTTDTGSLGSLLAGYARAVVALDYCQQDLEDLQHVYPLCEPFVILPAEAVVTSENQFEQSLLLAPTSEGTEPAVIPAQTVLKISEKLVLVAADLRETDKVVLKNDAGELSDASPVLRLPPQKPLQAIDYIEQDYPELMAEVTVVNKSCEIPTSEFQSWVWKPAIPEELKSLVAPTDYPWTVSPAESQGLDPYDAYTFEMCLNAFDQEARNLGARLVDPEQVSRLSADQLSALFSQTQQLNIDLVELLEELLSRQAAEQIRPTLIRQFGPLWLSLPGGKEDLKVTEQQYQEISQFVQDDQAERIENLLLLKTGLINREDLRSQMAGLLDRQEQEIRAFLTEEQLAMFTEAKVASNSPTETGQQTSQSTTPANDSQQTSGETEPDEEEDAPVRKPRIAPLEEFSTPFYLTMPFMIGAVLGLGLVLGGAAFIFLKRK